MNIFRNLVAYEYKKILTKKSSVIVLTLAIVLTAISVFGTLIGNDYDRDGNVVGTRYQYEMEERDFQRELSGREINGELSEETVVALREYLNSDSYQDEAMRKYYYVYSIASSVFGTDREEFIELTREELDRFYEIRSNGMQRYIEKSGMGENAQQAALASNDKISEPLVFECFAGYQRYLTIMYTTSIIAAAAIAILFAPVFSGEYASGADSLILSSKHGKGMVIGAKLFVLFTFAVGFALLLILISYVECMLIWGTDGASAALQLFLPMSSLPLTFAQCAFLYSMCIVAACILFAAITAILSSWIKTPFGTIVIMAVLLMAPLFINVPEEKTVLYNLFSLLPTNMMAIWYVFSDIRYDLFGVVLPPYTVMAVFSALVSAVLAVVAYNKFKRHQVA